MNRTYPGNPVVGLPNRWQPLSRPLQGGRLFNRLAWGWLRHSDQLCVAKIGHGESDEKVKELGFVYGLEHLYGGPPAGPKQPIQAPLPTIC